MTERTPRPPGIFVGGAKALMKIGSPVRQWMHTLADSPETWLTPVRYAPELPDDSKARLPYLEVTITQIMPPYAIVYHHNGREWVRLWIDTRETRLFPVKG